RDRERDARGSDARARQLRHLLGRGREIRGRDARHDAANGRSPEPLPRPLLVRHRRGCAEGSRAILQGIPDVRAALGAAHAGRARESHAGQLHAAVRRSAREGAWLGSEQRCDALTRTVVDAEEKQRVDRVQMTNADITRTFLFILILAGLITASLWTLSPFLSALLWATTIVVATWPLMLQVERLLGGRRALAVVVMTLVIAAVFVVPFGMAIAVLLDLAVEAVELVKKVVDNGLPPLPHWAVSLPWVGKTIETEWNDLVAHGPEGIAEVLRPYARSAASWTVSVTGGAGVVAIHFLLTVILAAILYSQGEVAANGVIAFARRIGGDRAEQTVRLAAQAARGVALGIVVTALVQSL